MDNNQNILCIGAVLWDVIGRSSSHMHVGSDVPGRITRLPGGVAMNIAMTLRRFDMRPAILTAIGKDTEGTELLDACHSMGIITDYVYLSKDLPTDRYVAVEGANGLISAIADSHSLEAAGDKILEPLQNGALGDSDAPYGGIIALDGSMTEASLSRVAKSPYFAAADLRIAPASPGKAERLSPLLDHPGATIYLNLEEAGLLCHRKFETSAEGAQGLMDRGARRVLVTDGAKSASDGNDKGILTANPPEVLVTRVTGAGDTFMAAHIAAENRGADQTAALNAALQAAANYVSGDTPL